MSSSWTSAAHPPQLDMASAPLRGGLPRRARQRRGGAGRMHHGDDLAPRVEDRRAARATSAAVTRASAAGTAVAEHRQPVSASSRTSASATAIRVRRPAARAPISRRAARVTSSGVHARRGDRASARAHGRHGRVETRRRAGHASPRGSRARRGARRARAPDTAAVRSSPSARRQPPALPAENLGQHLDGGRFGIAGRRTSDSRRRRPNRRQGDAKHGGRPLRPALPDPDRRDPRRGGDEGDGEQRCGHGRRGGVSGARESAIVSAAATAAGIDVADDGDDQP